MKHQMSQAKAQNRLSTVLLSAALMLPATSLSAAADLVELPGLEAFKARFNADVGVLRVILLLSPT